MNATFFEANSWVKPASTILLSAAAFSMPDVAPRLGSLLRAQPNAAISVDESAIVGQCAIATTSQPPRGAHVDQFSFL